MRPGLGLGSNGAVLPAIADPWLKAYRAHVAQFVLLLVVVACLMYTGGLLRTRIFDEMLAIWRRSATRPARPRADSCTACARARCIIGHGSSPSG